MLYVFIRYGATRLIQTSIVEESPAERGFPQQYLSRPICILLYLYCNRVEAMRNYVKYRSDIMGLPRSIVPCLLNASSTLNSLITVSSNHPMKCR